MKKETKCIFCFEKSSGEMFKMPLKLCNLGISKYQLTDCNGLSDKKKCPFWRNKEQ